MQAIIGLGSNQGNREDWLLSAAKALEHVPGIEPQALSSAYQTDPIGPVSGKFLNAAMLLQTTLGPGELMGVLLGIEAGLGRQRGVENHQGPRNIDLDLLLYHDFIVESEHATVPHPRLKERAFALIPLLEIWPEAKDPHTGQNYINILNNVKSQGVERGKPLPEVIPSDDHPHTADLCFSVTGASLASTLELAALNLIDVMVDRELVIEKERLIVEVEGGDHVEEMVLLLGEIPSLFEAKDFVPRRASLLYRSKNSITMALYGQKLDSGRQIRRQVKAVTYHNAKLALDDKTNRWTAVVVIDV